MSWFVVAFISTETLCMSLVTTMHGRVEGPRRRNSRQEKGAAVCLRPCLIPVAEMAVIWEKESVSQEEARPRPEINGTHLPPWIDYDPNI
jgi:hypothetical protein